MTEWQQAEYEGQGYLLVEDALSADELDRVRCAFAEAAQAGALEDLPNQDDCFIHLAEHPNLFPIIHRILSDDVSLRSLAAISVEPGAAGRGWHRKVAGMLGVHHAASNLCLQLFVCLDDTPPSGGCLAVVPASHRFKAEVPFPDITYIEEMPHYLPLRLKAGSAAVLHGNLWQARTSNRADVALRLLEYTYVHSWMRQALPELAPQALETITARDNLAHLFGVAAAPSYWTGKVKGYPSSDGLPQRRYSPLSSVGKGTEPNY